MGNNGHKQALHFRQPPQRVVSLVPSLTESLFDLGLGSAVVGITDYCIYPEEGIQHLPRLGGPKNPHLEAIQMLKPDLVLANQEENTRQAVETLEASGVAVWVTFPRTVRQAMDVLWALAELFRSDTARVRLQTLELTLDWALSAASERRTVRYFCPIWYEETPQPWWMTFNHQTYCHDLLHILGGENIFAERERRYPLAADLGLEPPQEAGKRDTRYPRVTLEEILAGQPEVVLLPDEPFAFDQNQRDQLGNWLASTPAAHAGRIYPVEGSLITWHGTRLARALRDLPNLLELAH
jgi:iron complex transport system substrate-binding protein